jgi:hypothetical protein
MPNAPTAAIPPTRTLVPTTIPTRIVAPTAIPQPTVAAPTANPAYPGPLAPAAPAPTNAPIVPGTTNESISGDGTAESPFKQTLISSIPITSSIELKNGDGLKVKLISGNGDVLLTWRNASGTKTGDLLIPINQLSELSAIAADADQTVEVKLIPASGMSFKVEIHKVVASAMPNTAGDCESWPCP